MAYQAKRITDQLEFLLSRVTADIGKALVVRLRTKNPKYTGHSSFNWIASQGHPFGREVGNRQRYLKTHDFSYLDPKTQIESLHELAGYTIAKGDLHVTNYVWYMELLMAGSSQKAEAGWVENIIESVVEHADVYWRRWLSVRATL